MIDFSPNRPIYLQIADRLADAILSGEFQADERIPSVREYSALMGVNTGTCMKAYDFLSTSGVIYNRRGMGYYVSADASQRITDERRKAFMESTMPELFRTMRLLGIDIDEVTQAWNQSL